MAVARGVSYCAICDGPFFQDQTIAVVGGGNTAVEDANYLTRFAKKVSIVHRGGQFSAQRIAQERALGNPKIDVLWNTVVTAILGEQGVRAVRLRSIDDGAERELAVRFGVKPIKMKTPSIKEHAKHDALGFFLTDELMETSIAGIFAVGDIRAQPVHQVTNTVADGTVAAHHGTKAYRGA